MDLKNIKKKKKDKNCYVYFLSQGMGNERKTERKIGWLVSLGKMAV